MRSLSLSAMRSTTPLFRSLHKEWGPPCHIDKQEVGTFIYIHLDATHLTPGYGFFTEFCSWSLCWRILQCLCRPGWTPEDELWLRLCLVPGPTRPCTWLGSSPSLSCLWWRDLHCGSIVIGIIISNLRTRCCLPSSARLGHSYT